MFAGVADPVGSGIVESLARPGGNLTGLSLAFGEGFSGKWVELLKEAIPEVSRFAVLLNPATPVSQIFLREMQGAARVLRVRLQVFEARDVGQLAAAFSLIEKARARGLIVKQIPSSERIQGASSNSREGAGCRRCTSSGNSRMPGASWPTGQASPTSTGAQPIMCTGY